MDRPLRAIIIPRRVDTAVTPSLPLRTEVRFLVYAAYQLRTLLAYYPQQQRVAYTEERKQKKGPGMGTALLAGSWIY